MRRDMPDGDYDDDLEAEEVKRYGVIYPQNLLDEQVVLGACMLDPATAQWVVRHANVQDFYRSAHRDIFSAIVQVLEEGDEASIVSVAGVLRRTRALEHWAGAEYLIKTTKQVPTVIHAQQSLRALRKLRVLRALVKFGNQTMNKAGDREADGLAIATEAGEQLKRVPDLLAVDERGCITANEAMENLRDIRWLWEDWVPRGHLTMMIAQPGVGKSALALHLAGRLAAGGDWPDDAAGPDTGRVLYCDTESSQALLLTRIRDWGLPQEAIILPGDDGMHRVRLNHADSMNLATRTAEREGVGLVVIDSLRTAFDGDENSSEVADVLTPWIEAAAEHDFALVVVHHLRKRQEGEGGRVTLDRMRGSSALPALARSVIALTPMTSSDKPGARVEVIKSNFAAPPWPLMMTLDRDGCYFERWDDETMTLADAPTPPAPTLQERVQEHLRERLADGPVAASELVPECKEAFGASRASVYRARDAVGVDSVKSPGTGANMWGITEIRELNERVASQPVLPTGTDET